MRQPVPTMIQYALIAPEQRRAMIRALALGLRILSHLIGIPFMFFGLAVARWSQVHTRR